MGRRTPTAQDFGHERSFRRDVRLPIPRKSRRQITLQGRIRVTQSAVSAETIPENEMIPPEGAVDRSEVHVIRARIPTSEKLTPGNLLLSAVHIVGFLEYAGAFRYGRTFGVACKNVYNRLGRQSGNGGASCVLEHHRESRRREALPQSLGLRCKETGPSGIVRRHSNCPALKT